jgi:hypothetical protein
LEVATQHPTFYFGIFHHLNVDDFFRKTLFKYFNIIATFHKKIKYFVQGREVPGISKLDIREYPICKYRPNQTSNKVSTQGKRTK